jgi:hypothetical protein
MGEKEPGDRCGKRVAGRCVKERERAEKEKRLKEFFEKK